MNNNYVIEAVIRQNEERTSRVNLLDVDGEMIAELNPKHDLTTLGEVSSAIGVPLAYSKLIRTDKTIKTIESLGDVLRAAFRPATPAEIKACKGVIHWQESAVSIANNAITNLRSSSQPATFINESGLEFQDISSELERVYNFGGKGFVKIQYPLWLHVSSSGGHRLFSQDGKSHYVPSGWVELTWTAKAGQPNFVK